MSNTTKETLYRNINALKRTDSVGFQKLGEASEILNTLLSSSPVTMRELRLMVDTFEEYSIPWGTIDDSKIRRAGLEGTSKT